MLLCLSNRSSREAACLKIYAAPDGWVMRLTEPKRSLEQNAKFHAMCEDLAKSGLKWADKPRDKAQWKVLLVSGHGVATGHGAELVLGLEGEFVNLRESTAQMGVSRAISLIDYTSAFCADRGVFA